MSQSDTMPEAGPPQVLLVDDDPALCAMLGEYLGADGFATRAVHDGRAAVAALRGQPADIVVMDITMPRLDGFGALREIRAFSRVPVLMLTARGDEVDRIVGLELGADDYLGKPFNPRELSARLRAILRRARPAPPGDCLASDELLLDTGARTLLRAGVPVALTEAEYAILEQLLRHAGDPVSREALSLSALGRAWRPFDRSLDTHLSNLRRKLGDTPAGLPRIRTLRGRGYLWAGAAPGRPGPR
jgi:DNA-binding response OmpR family regulator